MITIDLKGIDKIVFKKLITFSRYENQCIDERQKDISSPVKKWKTKKAKVLFSTEEIYFYRSQLIKEPKNNALLHSTVRYLRLVN